jgi:hypothetical protein
MMNYLVILVFYFCMHNVFGSPKVIIQRYSVTGRLTLKHETLSISIFSLYQTLNRQDFHVILPINLEIKSYNILFKRPKIFIRNPFPNQPLFPPYSLHPPLDSDSPMMLPTPLVLIERPPILVVTHKRILEPPAALDRVRDRRSADDEP